MARARNETPPDGVTQIHPIYDDRGNVRPSGTPGAREMTYAERVAIAEGLQDTGPDHTDDPTAA